MSYQALYRKFRPETFDDVKGQDAIVTTLLNQLKSKRTGHAYLFCGTRGTGKTTVAKILGKALNCTDLKENGPCCECDMCKSIKEGKAMNVIEIDAASNNSVDNIREIIDDVAYRPSSGEMKVYIIDEVHMLSQGAFNALLKTLEEPPEYVAFILATTEAHKIPATILSRCQRYDFKRITVKTIVDRLMELTNKEGVSAEEKALRYVAKIADGSMRDALSLLDQCMAFYMDKILSFDRVLEVLGSVDTEVFSRLLLAVLEGDVVRTMEISEELVLSGRDLSRITEDYVWYLRNLLLSKSSDNMEEVLDVTEETYNQMKEDAAKIETDSLLRMIRICSELAAELKQTTQKRVVFEVALIKMCRPQMEVDTKSLLERIRVLEKSVEDLSKRPVVVEKIEAEKKEVKNKPKPAKVKKEEIPEVFAEIKNRWEEIVSKIGQTATPYFKKSKLMMNKNKELVILMDGFGVATLENGDKEELIRDAIIEVTNKDVEFTIVGDDNENLDDYIDFVGVLGVEPKIEKK